MLLWRLVPKRRAATPWDGEGPRLLGGRWSGPGTACVYLSDHLSLCALEILVHAEVRDLPEEYAACALEVPDDVAVVEVSRPEKVSAHWRDTPAPPALQANGDAWIRGAGSALLRVPSAIIPAEGNYLLNIAHPDFKRMKQGAVEVFHFDPRLYLGP